MHLSTRGRYAVMALLDLAKIQEGKQRTSTVKLSEVAERQDISLSYLEQLFAQLRKGGLVKSMRGPGGGYTLATSPDNTYISDIVKAVDEELTVTRCDAHTSGKGCVKSGSCNAHHLWVALSDCVEVFLSKISLAMVLNSGHMDVSVMCSDTNSGSCPKLSVEIR